MSETAPPPAACRICGCTELDCSQCIAKTGEPCCWVEGDLCSACATPEQMAAAAAAILNLPVEMMLAMDLRFRDRQAEAADPAPPASGLEPIDWGETFLQEEGAANGPYIRGPNFGGDAFADLSDQQNPNDFLRHLADLTGNPGLQKLADEGAGAWATAYKPVDLQRGFESQYNQEPVDLTEEDKRKLENEIQDHKRWRERRNRERGG